MVVKLFTFQTTYNKYFLLPLNSIWRRTPNIFILHLLFLQFHLIIRLYLYFIHMTSGDVPSPRSFFSTSNRTDNCLTEIQRFKFSNHSHSKEPSYQTGVSLYQYRHHRQIDQNIFPYSAHLPMNQPPALSISNVFGYQTFNILLTLSLSRFSNFISLSKNTFISPK